MKIVIYSLLAIAWLIYMSEPNISFKPFSIEFGKPYHPFAWLFLVVAIVLFQKQQYEIGYEKGMNDLYEYLVKDLKDLKK
jgi:hypothetical protein